MDDRSERVPRRLDIPMLFIALLVIPTIILEESHVGQEWKDAAEVLNALIWVAFVAELAIMLRVVLRAAGGRRNRSAPRRSARTTRWTRLGEAPTKGR